MIKLIPQGMLRVGLRNALRYAVRPVLKPGIPLRWQRQWLEWVSELNRPHPDVAIDRLDIGGVDVECLRPHRRGSFVILYLHGGAFCVGSSRTHRALTTRLAHYAGATLWCPEYRLAPEYPYPQALEDAVQTYEHLLQRGFDASRLIIAGDSAGGGLALAATLRLKEMHRPLPAAMLLFSPLVDLQKERDATAVNDPLLNEEWVRHCAELYLSGSEPPVAADDPGASPLHADLRGLPPTLIQVAREELLREDSWQLQNRMRDADVPVQYQEYAHLWHVFQLHAGLLATADEALQAAAGFLRRCVLKSRTHYAVDTV